MNVMLSKTMVKIQRNNEFIKIDAEKKWIYSSDSIETCAYLHNEDILFVLNTFRKIGKEGYDCWGGVKEVIEHNEDKVSTLPFEETLTMIQGVYRPERFLEIFRDYIYFQDSEYDSEEKEIVCRYPQFFAARLLKKSIIKSVVEKSGKGGI